MPSEGPRTGSAAKLVSPNVDGEAVRALGRMALQILDAKSGHGPLSPVARHRNTAELRRLPAEVRNIIAAQLDNRFPGLFAMRTRKAPIDPLEIENAGYPPDASFTAVERVECLDDALGDLMAAGLTAAPARFASLADALKAFLEAHPDLKPDTFAGDEHYLERRFLAEVFLPVLGANALDRIEPQVPMVGSDGRERRIDFVLRGSRAYAIELEGRQFHDASSIGRERFEDEKRRQRDLQRAGYAYTPFSFDEVASGTALEAFTTLCAEDKVLRTLLDRAEVVEDPSRTARYAEAAYLFREFPVAFRRLQVVILARIVEAALSAEDLRIVNVTPRWGLANMAIADLMVLIERCAQLYGLDVHLPCVQIQNIVRAEDDRDFKTALASYYANPSYLEDGLDARLDGASESQVANRNVRFDPTMAVEPGAMLVAAEPPFDALLEAPDGTQLWSPVDAESDVAAREVLEHGPVVRPRVRLAPYESGNQDSRFAEAAPGKRVLDYFARRLFDIPFLYRPQYETILRTLALESSLVLLATGGGKSLCYQLTALLSPGLAIVVSPLRSLIRDQLEALAELGITGVTGTTSDDTQAERAALFQSLQRGAFKLLYLSPERLQIGSFLHELRLNVGRWGVWLLVVDEAHCVSEWGHDFRPAYVGIRDFAAAVSESGGASLPVLALTATASALVRQDVLRVLDIDESGFVSYGTVDRPEISFSVHPVDAKAGQARSERLVRLFEEGLGRALHLEMDELLPRIVDPAARAEHASVIFTIYADPHGRQTTPLGVAEVRDALVQAELVRPGDRDSRIHASTPVTVCPAAGCGTHRFSRDRESRQYLCEMGHEFQEPVPLYAQWDERMRKNQDEFKRDRFPVLVATKGYGMGIDKPNIRTVTHIGFASGIESYYQEVGRAGRDRRHSHAALIYEPPTEDCVAEHLNSGGDLLGESVLEPPCVQGNDYRFWRCPYGLPRMCDYGLQARFVRDSYPGEDRDVSDALDVARRLIRSGSSSEVTIGPYSERRLKRAQIALHRLRQLGWIESHELEYRGRDRAMLRVKSHGAPGVPSAREHLFDALARLALSDRQARLRRLRSFVDELEPTGDEETESLGFLHSALDALVRETYVTVKGMRYQMLLHLWRYASDDARCRRASIRDALDSEPIADEDYRCGFCDSCRPDLSFDRARAYSPDPDLELQQVSKRLPEVLQIYDENEVSWVIETAASRRALPGLQARAEHALEADVTNITARAIAGRAAVQRSKEAEERGDSRRAAEINREAIVHFADGYRASESRVGNDEATIGFYEAALEVDPAIALGLADRVGGTFDDREGHRRLLRDSASHGDGRRSVVMAGHVVVDELTRAAELIDDALLTRIRRVAM